MQCIYLYIVLHLNKNYTFSRFTLRRMTYQRDLSSITYWPLCCSLLLLIPFLRSPLSYSIFTIRFLKGSLAWDFRSLRSLPRPLRASLSSRLCSGCPFGSESSVFEEHLVTMNDCAFLIEASLIGSEGLTSAFYVRAFYY